MVKQASPEVLERSMEMTRDVAEAAQREIWEKAQRRLPAVQMGMVAGTLGALATAASYRLTLLLLEKKLPPEAAAAVARGEADGAVVACWTGTGACIAANKVPGVRAALCTDAETARGARRWNDANVLVLSLRLLSAPLLEEILDAWFGEAASDAEDDRAPLRTLAGLDARRPR